MKITKIVNPNAGQGFKLVTVEMTVEGHTIESDWFIHPDGRVESHKNTWYDLERQILTIIIETLSKKEIK